MCGVFDMEEGEFLMKMSDGVLMDSEGNLMQLVGDSMAACFFLTLLFP